MVTPNSVAVGVANEIMSISAELIMLYNRIKVVDKAWNDDNVANYLAAMTTAVLNSDGTQGNSDATPNAAHPILYGLYNLSRPVTATQITQMKSGCDDVAAYIDGSAVSANPGAHAILDVAVGG